MKYYMILDDSGQLHPNYPSSDFFVYGGILVSESEFHKTQAAYRKIIRQIKKEKGIIEEYKTSQMKNNTKRRLLKMLQTYEIVQIFVCAKVSLLKKLDFSSSKDVVRFKNYMIRRLVGSLTDKKLIPRECNSIEIYIDNQNIAHSAKDSLEEYLYNIFNEENYYQVHLPYDKQHFKRDFLVKYKDSKENYLVQAADLLANTQGNILLGHGELSNLLKDGYVVLKLPDNVMY